MASASPHLPLGATAPAAASPSAPQTKAIPVPQEQPIARLTADVAAGRPEALTTFYEAYFDRVYAGARRALGGDEAACLDLVQEVMLKAIRALPIIESEAGLEAWLARVVRTCAIDALRSRQRRLKREATANAQRVEELKAALEQTDEQLQWLREEIAALDSESARLLTLRYRCGWTLSQIGLALGLSPGAVDRRLRTIVTTLKRRGRDHR